jgi:hypothetical protein
MAYSIKNKNRDSSAIITSDNSTPAMTSERAALSGWPMILGWMAMLIFAFHASTHMVGAGDTWVAMASGRHFINHGVNTVEPFSANTHKAGPTEEEIKTWPNWAQWITKKVGIETVKYWHPTGWINQNWLTHVIFYWLTTLSPFADAQTLSFNTLVYWKFAVYIITIICVYYTGRLLGAHPALSAAFSCFALFAGRSFLDIRPAGFSNLLVAVFLLILALTTYRNVLYIWLIVPMTVFWCNVHGGYIYVFIMLAPFVVLNILTNISGKRFVSIGPKGILHTIAAGFVALVAAIVFNPFHLTNFTHTFIISVSEHAKMWRQVNEWHPAFAWQNPVGTGFPFLILFILIIGAACFWLFSRFFKPKLTKAPKGELEAQEEQFKLLSKIFGFAAAILICWVTFISFSFVKADVAGLFFCAALVCILLLSIYKSIHFIYLGVGLTLLALGSGSSSSDYSGRYIFPFVILPAYVTLGIFTSLFSKTAKIESKNIVYAAAAAVVAISSIVIISNPLKFGFLFSIGPENQRHLDNGIAPPQLRQQFEKSETPLSQKVAVSVKKPGSRWSITDESKKFSVRKEEFNLSIYKYESESPVWRMRQLLQPHQMRRSWKPEYERNLEITYKYLFDVLYILNIGSVVIWLALPYLRKLFCLLPDKVREFSQAAQYELPRIDLPLMAIAALTIYMAYRSRRFIPIAAIAACPVLAMLIDQMIRTISAARNFYKNRLFFVSPMPYNLQMFFISAAALAVVIFGAWWGLKFKRVYLDFSPNDEVLNSVFIRMTASHAKPFYACQFIRDNKLKGKMFNYWTEGGFIAWGQVPDPNTGRTPLQLFMDGRAQAAYEPTVYKSWLDIMSGGPHAQIAAYRKTSPDYVKVGQWIDEQLKKFDVWVVLIPMADIDVYNGPLVQGLESIPNVWPLVYLDDTQKLYVDVTTPQGKELFDGIFTGKTLYPGESTRDLMISYHMLAPYLNYDRKKGLDFAFNSFNLHKSQAAIQSVIQANRYPELRPAAMSFCKNYFDDFVKNQNHYMNHDGSLHKTWAAIIAGHYLRGVEKTRGNSELAQFYDAKIDEFRYAQEAIQQKKRW